MLHQKGLYKHRLGTESSRHSIGISMEATHLWYPFGHESSMVLFESEDKTVFRGEQCRLSELSTPLEIMVPQWWQIKVRTWQKGCGVHKGLPCPNISRDLSRIPPNVRRVGRHRAQRVINIAEYLRIPKNSDTQEKELFGVCHIFLEAQSNIQNRRNGFKSIAPLAIAGLTMWISVLEIHLPVCQPVITPRLMRSQGQITILGTGPHELAGWCYRMSCRMC